MRNSKIFYFVILVGLFLFIECNLYSQAIPNFGGDKSSKKIAEKTEEAYPDIDEFVAVDQQPAIIKRAPVSYPELAKKARIEGNVYLKVLVDKDGKPKKAVVFKSDAEVFNEAAIQSALKSTYSAAVSDGKPVASWLVLPFTFKL